MLSLKALSYGHESWKDHCSQSSDSNYIWKGIKNQENLKRDWKTALNW